MSDLRLVNQGPTDRHGDGYAWKANSTRIAVVDAAGRTIAEYRRDKTYRHTETVASFAPTEPGKTAWPTFYAVPAADRATYRNLRAWFCAEVARRYGITVR